MRHSLVAVPVVLTLALFMTPGCGDSSSTTEDVTPTVEETSPAINVDAFAQGSPIPAKHSCEGEDVSPKIQISGIDSGAKSLVLIVDDPDAPGGTWNHWILYDIPVSTSVIEEGATPAGAITGLNDFRQTQYDGPCPPGGSPHRYYFRLFALSVDTLGLAGGAYRAQVDAAMAGVVLAGYPVEYMGTYQR